MDRIRVAVIAGNHSQYRNFVERDRPIAENFEYFYVSDEHSLRGVRCQVVLWGTYWENPAYEFYKNEYKAFEYVNNQTDREWDD